MSVPDTATLVARHVGPARPLTRPEMSNEPGTRWRVRVTSRGLERDGDPFVPVSGEMHFSRVPRRQWDERLRLMRAGGITAVSCYVIWIHHEEVRGEYRFDGDRDLRAFVEVAKAIGLDVVLRIGPWAHGEVRNGGFPDWVQQAPVAHRTDDAAYLDLVQPWFRRVASELDGLLGPDGPVFAIQIENELYDQPGHLSTLRTMAQDAGLIAGIYTATAWGAASLPAGVVYPLYGGYSDGFWVDHDAPWDATFRAHFFFSHVWDDPGIGADVRSHIGTVAAADAASAPSDFPPATCELGGGMARAYHRRPVVAGRDVAAMALTKIGNGSAWQGYYMYTGGRNPAGETDLQETQATGYPNDMPRFDYDFGAPIGATGRAHESHALLRRQHAFLSSFSAELGATTSILPVVSPTGVDDTTTMRWAVRSDGSSGFVFVSRHQPIEPLPPSEPVTFEVVLEDRAVAFPRRPVSIPAGTLAIWPLELTVGPLTVHWATATVLTRFDAPSPTLVLTADAGVPVQLAVDAAVDERMLPAGVAHRDGVLTVDTDESVVITLAGVDVVVLSDADAAQVWVIDDEAGRRLAFAPDALWVAADGSLSGRTSAITPEVRRYAPERRAIVPVATTLLGPSTSGVLEIDVMREPGPVPETYGDHHGRASAPGDADFAASALRARVSLPDDVAGSVADAELEVDWAGDVLRLLVDGVVVADQFWAGETFVADLRDVGVVAGSVVELEILPLHPRARVGLSADAGARRAAAGSEALISLTEARVVTRARWCERRGDAIG